MTSKELSYIVDALSQEKSVIKKYEDYREEITDPALKNLCTKLASKHQQHYDQLYGMLSS